jgi:nitrogenase molybdenum-iron protein beta chain
VHASTGGFKGYNQHGHELVVEAIVEQFLEPSAEVVPNLVNVWSVIPYQDTFWAGNLRALSELLKGIGLEPNILFGHDSGGVESWKRIPSAAFNLVISPWAGLSIAEKLQKRFGTPFLHYPVLPIGAVETSRFLRSVAEFAQLPSSQVDPYIVRKEDLFYHYLDRAADFFMEMRWDLPARFITIADSFYSLGISRFLVNELSMVPGQQFVTDEPPEHLREGLREQFANLNEKVSAEVLFSNDSDTIGKLLRIDNPELPSLFLGTSWDRDLARRVGGYHLSIGLPITDRLVLDRAYIGYEGGLRLIEDIYASVLNTY